MASLSVAVLLCYYEALEDGDGGQADAAWFSVYVYGP